MNKLVFDHVKKTYGKVTALDDFSISVKEHELLVILGTSGSGKTTLLRIIAGLEREDSGDIFLGDNRLEDIDIRERKVALVFQNYALYPQMTAYQNLTLSLKQNNFYKPVLDRFGKAKCSPDYEKIEQIKIQIKQLENNSEKKEKKRLLKKEIKSLKKNPTVPLYSYQSLTKNEIEERLEKIKAILDLSSFLNQRTSTLSGGQKQRVALGKALLKEPDILLMDEPLSNIDAKLRASSRELIRRIHQKANSTTIISTHDQNDAYALADRVMILDEGRIVQVGTIDEIFNHPKNITAAKFLGSPQINLIKAYFTGKELLVGSTGINIIPDTKQNSLLLPYINKDIIIGIRPENIKFNEDGCDIDAVYEKSEIYGKDFLHHIRLGDEEIVIKSRNKLKGGNQGIKLSFCNIIFFDAENEENIGN